MKLNFPQFNLAPPPPHTEETHRTSSFPPLFYFQIFNGVGVFKTNPIVSQYSNVLCFVLGDSWKASEMWAKDFGDFFFLGRALGRSETSAFSSGKALAEGAEETMASCSVPQ